MRPYFAKVFIGTGFEPTLDWFQSIALTTQLQLPQKISYLYNRFFSIYIYRKKNVFLNVCHLETHFLHCSVHSEKSTIDSCWIHRNQIVFIIFRAQPLFLTLCLPARVRKFIRVPVTVRIDLCRLKVLLGYPKYNKISLKFNLKKSQSVQKWSWVIFRLIETIYSTKHMFIVYITNNTHIKIQNNVHVLWSLINPLMPSGSFQHLLSERLRLSA